MFATCRFVSVALLLVHAASLTAQTPPTYAGHVQPFFQRYCVECHNDKDAEASLSLQSYKGLTAGGDSGVVVVAGQPDKSLLVGTVEHKNKPFMPPRKAKQPTAEEISLVRAWVAAGAKNDGLAKVVRLPAIKAKAAVATPLTAVACSPDGKLCAVSGRAEVVLVDAATGEVKSRLPAGRARVTAVAFDASGKTLAGAASSFAGGSDKAGHEVRLWRLAPSGAWQAAGTLAAAHGDVVHELTFSRDGKFLATASYDRLVKVWDVASNKELHALKDHSDSVYGLAFSPDGKLLASGGADRAIKVWDVASGKRLYTLGESTDWVYAVAWSPTGKKLAGAGVDRSIRVWEVDGQGGKLVRSAFAHSGAVTRLVYSADGKTLYSLGEDKLAKSWDAASLGEKSVYPRQSETPLALAVRSQPAELLVGRYDGVLTAFDVVTARARQVLPALPRPPVLGNITPASLPRGRTTVLSLAGQNLAGCEVVSDLPGLKASLHGNQATLSVPDSVKPGRYTFQLKNSAGLSVAKTILVDRFAAVAEVEPNDSARSGQAVRLPATVVGAIGRAGDLDWFRFELNSGDEVGAQALTAEIGSKLSPVLTLVDADGNAVAETTSGHLGYQCKKSGTYALGMRDRDYRGGADLTYRLSIGPIPVVTSHFPLGARQGSSVEVHLSGVHLGGVEKVRVEVPKTAAPGSRVPVVRNAAAETPLGMPSLSVGEFAEFLDLTKDNTLAVPGTANGRIATPGAAQKWQFAAKKGQRLIVEVQADRIGSPLDSTIEILDAAGKPLPRAVLRSTARTYIAFRDHDSRTPGIRLETWGELAVNDHLLVGSEVVRIRALPRNPDDDCQFFSGSGQRLGYLGSTPVHHPQATPMYKVSIHPPGTTFPENGLPLVTLFWRNDDGGPGFGKDSRLAFDPPADGTYQVRVRDARGEGSPAHGYRLTVRPPRPDFTVSASVGGLLSKGGSVPVRVNVSRLDEFDGVIDMKVVGLPEGFSAPASNIFGDDNDTVFVLSADGKAKQPSKPVVVRLVARASVGGKEVVHEASLTLPKLAEAGDIVTTTDEKEVPVKPGTEARLTVRVARRNGFAGRIPVEVQGLPHGVRVLDIGLNGILITPAETRRTIVIQCDPGVKPMQHPIVVLSRHERKGSEHAAGSVLLRVRQEK